MVFQEKKKEIQRPFQKDCKMKSQTENKKVHANAF